KSGKVITAAHVVADCPTKDLEVSVPGINAPGKTMTATEIVKDERFDLAFISLPEKVDVPTFPLSPAPELPPGITVDTWGFPVGYGNVAPLLTVGYLAGVENDRILINSAFNNGNSGGPVVNRQNGMLIGVAIAKIAPIPPDIETALN